MKKIIVFAIVIIFLLVVSVFNKPNIESETTIYTYAEQDVDSILKSLEGRVIKIEQLDEATIYYAYSKRIEKFYFLDGMFVNIQIACNAENIKVGIPIIVGYI